MGNEIQYLESIIDLQVRRPHDVKYEGEIKVTLSSGFEHLYNPPFNLLIFDYFDRVIWSSKLYPNTWSYYPNITGKKMKIIDCYGNTISKWKWEIIKDGCLCHQLFYLWSLKNRGAFGIAIGTHDGSYGEWVSLVNQGILSALLIEPSTKQFEVLSGFYYNKNWVRCEQKLVTTEGGKVKFYEGYGGETNSVKKDHIENISGNVYDEVEMDSESLISILENNQGYKWLHLDVEGIDAELILSLRNRLDLLPEVLIYEHTSLTIDEEEFLKDFLIENNYTLHRGSSRNTIGFRKIN